MTGKVIFEKPQPEPAQTERKVIQVSDEAHAKIKQWAEDSAMSMFKIVDLMIEIVEQEKANDKKTP